MNNTEQWPPTPPGFSPPLGALINEATRTKIDNFLLWFFHPGKWMQKMTLKIINTHATEMLNVFEQARSQLLEREQTFSTQSSSPPSEKELENVSSR